MRFESCIFDLYGTLADIRTDEESAVFWEGAAADAEGFGARYSGEALRREYLRLCADEVKRRSAQEPEVPEAFVEPELLNVFRRLLPEGADAAAFARAFRRRSTLRIRLMPHASETLDALKARDVRIFLLSNAQACFTRDELDLLGLTERFDGIVLSSDEGMKKPYRGLFELLLTRYGIDRHTAVMVGNDAVADIGGAVSAGLSARYIHTEQSGKRPDALPAGCSEIADLCELSESI